MFEAPQGKPCPRCGEPLSDIASQFQRVCTNGKTCGAVWPWELKPGQKPLHSCNRDRRAP